MKAMLLFTLVLVAAVAEGYHVNVRAAGEEATDVQRMLGAHENAEERQDICTGKACVVPQTNLYDRIEGVLRVECRSDEYGMPVDRHCRCCSKKA